MKKSQQIVRLAMFCCLAAALAGAIAAGIPPAYLFEFPPVSMQLAHQPFHPGLFAVVLGISLLGMGFVLWRYSSAAVSRSDKIPVVKRPFPLWGYGALALLTVSWLLAWHPESTPSALRFYTFSGIWLGYILLANALCHTQGGAAPLWRHGTRYLQLFAASAVFWWAFELINRIVENWVYLDIDALSASGYVMLASMAFSTVLPAVYVTQELLAVCVPRLEAFNHLRPLHIIQSRTFWTWMLLLGLLSLFLLAFAPTELYAAVWIAPALVVPALQELSRQRSIFSRLAQGDAREIALWSAAGLVCGFLWECWNYYSLPKWVYHVSYLDAVHLFEMPLLGYLGYIPFGCLCGTFVLALMPPEEEPPDPMSGIEVPQHVAIIMDGNGRWATHRGLPRPQGHIVGAERVRGVIESARHAGVRYLTLFAFSTENWRRPETEVNAIFGLFADYLDRNSAELLEKNVRLRIIGERQHLSPFLQRKIANGEAATEGCGGLQLILAISYGGRREIVSAVARLITQHNNANAPQDLEPNDITQTLYLPDVPDPEILIRTGGEQRISNFLLWQCAYSELVFTPVLWPDFSEADFRDCLHEYTGRTRRFGGVPGSDKPIGGSAVLTP